MPPPPRILTDTQLADFFRALEVGEYRLSVTSAFEPFLAPEGGWFFAVGDKTLVIWRHDGDGLAEFEPEPEPKRTYSICPKTETGLHEWTVMPIGERMTLDATDAWTAMNVPAPSRMECSQCGKLYSEHVTVEGT